MKEASYYSKLKEKKVKCTLCPNNCIIKDSKYGKCLVRKNISGKLFTLVYARPCSINIDPIEKKPLYHFLPSSYTYSIGTFGCNLKCQFCQNYEISQHAMPKKGLNQTSPKDIVRSALSSGCRSISYTYNEPTVFFEFAYDIAKLAKKSGLKNIFVSNGYINKKPLLKIIKLIDAFNIDLKGFTEKFYHGLCSAHLKPVLDNLNLIRKNNTWLELTYLIIPQHNDDLDQIKKMCMWISSNLGKNTVLHLSRFFPLYNMKSSAPTKISILKKAKDIALSSGLNYVYIGNVSDLDTNTYCSNCSSLIINREDYDALDINLSDGKCISCNKEIAGVWK